MISYGMSVSKRIVGVGKFMGLITANSQLVTSLYGFFGFVSQANNLNLYAAPIAIVGENGAGKTTLVKLLLHLYQPETGNIFYNSHPIEDYNVTELRSKIGTAFLAANVHALSLAENLRIYKDMNRDDLDEIVEKLELTNVQSKSKAASTQN